MFVRRPSRAARGLRQRRGQQPRCTLSQAFPSIGAYKLVQLYVNYAEKCIRRLFEHISTFHPSAQWKFALCVLKPDSKVGAHPPRLRHAPPRCDGYTSLVSQRRFGNHSRVHHSAALCATPLLFASFESVRAAGRRRRLRPSRLPIRRPLLPRCAAYSPRRCSTCKQSVSELRVAHRDPLRAPSRRLGSRPARSQHQLHSFGRPLSRPPPPRARSTSSPPSRCAGGRIPYTI